MAISDIEHRRPTQRVGQDAHARNVDELSLFSSLGLCLLAAILLGVGGWIGFEILLTLITMD